MNIIRNIFCEGTFEGSYRLDYVKDRYVWIIIEGKENYSRLDVKKGRDNYAYKSSNYFYGQTIPFEEGDLNGDF